MASEDWESALDKFDWNDVLAEVDGELLEHLASELSFRTYQALKESSCPLGRRISSDALSRWKVGILERAELRAGGCPFF